MPLKDYIGLDLGTSKFRFYKDRELISEVPVKIVTNKASPRWVNRIIMKEGKIASFTDVEDIIRQELKKINPPFWGIFQKSIKCFISVPSDMNKTALRAFWDLAEHMGSRQTYLLTDTLIIARALEIDISNSIYTIVDCGAGKTSITTMDGYKILSNKIIDCAGYKFDESIITYIRREYNSDISQEQAEDLKIKYSNISRSETDYSIYVKGKDRSTNQYKDIRVQATEISASLANDIGYIKEIILRHIGGLDVSISQQIEKSGIYCVGNSFKMKGFIDYIANDIPVSKKSYRTENNYMEQGIKSLFDGSVDISKYNFDNQYITPL